MSFLGQSDASDEKLGRGGGNPSDLQDLLNAQARFFERFKGLIVAVTLITGGLIALFGTTERLPDGTPELFHLSAFRAWAESVDIDTPLAWGLSFAVPLMLTCFVGGTLVRDPGKKWSSDAVVSLAYLEDAVRLTLLGLGVLFSLGSVVNATKGGIYWLESIFAAGFMAITCLLGAIVVPDANRTRLSLVLVRRARVDVASRLDSLSRFSADQNFAAVRGVRRGASGSSRALWVFSVVSWPLGKC